MMCGHADCTGYHRTNRPPERPLCPSVTERIQSSIGRDAQRRYDEKRTGSLKRILSSTASQSRAREALAVALPTIRIGGKDGTQG